MLLALASFVAFSCGHLLIRHFFIFDSHPFFILDSLISHQILLISNTVSTTVASHLLLVIMHHSFTIFVLLFLFRSTSHHLLANFFLFSPHFSLPSLLRRVRASAGGAGPASISVSHIHHFCLSHYFSDLVL